MTATLSQPKTKVRPRRRRTSWTTVARRTSQLIFAGFILIASIRHGLGLEANALASIDALCPFGGVETLWTWITTGRFVAKTHPSNLILGLGLLVGVLLAGNAFCGWICPFGAYQDALTWVRRKLHISEIKLPAKADRILRYGRFVVLGIILYATITSLKLWFAEYDPYRTLFGLNWLFEFNLAAMWPAFVDPGRGHRRLAADRTLLVQVSVPAGRRVERDAAPELPAHPPGRGGLQGVRAVRDPLSDGHQGRYRQSGGERGLHRLSEMRGCLPEARRLERPACADVARPRQAADEPKYDCVTAGG